MMTPENFSRIISTMRPVTNRIDAEVGLIKAMRAHRADASLECREDLLDASGAFYTRFSGAALESSCQGAYSDLLNNWVDMCVAYDRGVKGDEFCTLAFQMYRTMTMYRLDVS